MEFNVMQWRDELEEEEEENEERRVGHMILPNPFSASSPFPFFSQPNTTDHFSFPHYSSHHHHHPNTPLSATRLPVMGSYFNLTQWQELELQALIYGHMTAGAAVPEELLHLVRRSVAVADTAVYSLRPQNQPALGYWGRGTVDPEPERCRRTDGKKWRCSRDVVAGHKYCERHVHRGRNRSRKPVETAAPPYVGEAQRGGSGVFTLTATAASRSADLVHLNQRHCDSIIETKGRFKAQHDGQSTDRILRHFFDDWPKPLHEADCDTNYSSINLSVSMPENSSSDFSLTLATGTAGEHSGQVRHGLRDNNNYNNNNNNNNNNNRPHQLMSWGMEWENSQVAPMGGPLAEALRSAASSSLSSPMSMQHRLPRGSTS